MQNTIKTQLETTAKLHIQGQIRQGEYDLVWSYMSDFENAGNPNQENQRSIQEWENLAAYTCTSSPGILERGKEIERLNIRPKDALHISCAIESRCAYFITTDGGLTNKKVDGIVIINPIDFVREAEGSDGL